MTKRIALIAVLTALAAPSCAHAGFSGVVLFGSTALLDGTPSGDQGVPPRASTAVGDVVAVLAPSGQLSVDMAVAGMGSLANGAHVHGPAAPGTTGPVAFDLQQPQTTAFDLMAGPFNPTAAE